MSIKQRNITVDIAKYLGIVLVVVGHIDSPVSNNSIMEQISLVLYQFHVPLFFFVSGLFYNDNVSLKDFFVNKFKRLYVPYILVNVFCLCVYVIFHMSNGEQLLLVDQIKHMIKVSIGCGVTNLCGATWFLLVLFEALIIYKLLDHVCVRCGCYRSLHLIILLLVLSGAFCPMQDMIQRLITAISFVHLGRLSYLKMNDLFTIPNSYKLIVLLVSFTVSVLISRINNPDVAGNIYGNRVLFYVSAISGIVFTLTLSNFLSVLRIGKTLADLGKKTMSVLIWHFTAFRIVTAVQMTIFSLPFCTIFTHPCNMINGIWPLVYILAGLFVPFILSVLSERLSLK